MIKNVVITILLVLSIFLGFQVKNLNKTVMRLNEVCGEACAGVFVTFNISGLGEALESVSADKSNVKACLDAGQTVEKVNKDFNDAQELGITGTPGNILLNRETRLGVLIPGAFPLEILENVKGRLLETTIREGDTVYEDATNRVVLKAALFPALDAITDADNMKGPAEAKIALIEYSDFDCPFCKTFHPIAESFVTRNTDSMWVFRQYPLRNIHPDAQKKAESSECVRNLYGQEKFWEFAEALYKVTP